MWLAATLLPLAAEFLWLRATRARICVDKRGAKRLKPTVLIIPLETERLSPAIAALLGIGVAAVRRHTFLRAAPSCARATQLARNVA